MKKALIIVTMAIMLIGVHSIAHAVYFGLELVADDGNVVTVYDNSPADLNSLDGVVYFSGAVGPTWILNVTTGITYDVLGNQVDPHIDLNSVNVSTSGAGTLKIYAMALNFTSPGPGGLNLAAGGLTDGTVSIKEYYQARSPASFDTVGNPRLPLEGNVLFASLGPFGPGHFNDNGGGPLPCFDTPYALTLEGVIIHSGAGVSGFDAETQTVPEPSIMILLGISVLSLVGLRRKWKD